MKFLSVLLFGLFFSVAGLSLVAPVMPSLGMQKQQPPLVLGVFPRDDQALTLETFSPMAKYLTKKLKAKYGRRVLLVTHRDFNKFWEGVEQRKYDIVYFNQYHYILSKNLGYDVFAMIEENGSSTVTGALVVRKDSGINSIQDLKGKRILFGGGPKAMQAYIFATYLLRQGGLQDGDYDVQFALNPPSAVVNTYFKLYDAAAAGTGDVILEKPIVKQQIDVNELKILSKGEYYAHLPWAMKTELPAELKIEIQKIFLDMKNTPEGQKLLKRAGMTALVKAVDSDFDPHRRIVREVLGEVY